MQVATNQLEAQTRQECFLCALDTQACVVQMLEGRITSARQFRDHGELAPYITIDLGDSGDSIGSLATIKLTRTYNSLAERLIELGSDLRRRALMLRIYHLPAPGITTEFKDSTLTRYTANEFTLAILEPDTILNITDLNSADYCARQYLLNRLVSSPQSPAAIRGNMVHNSFKELLKEYDRGEAAHGDHAVDEETPLNTLQRHFEQVLERSALDLSLSNISADALRADVEPHLHSLANWFEKQHTTLWDMPVYSSEAQNGHERQAEANETNETNDPLVRAETFLLAPEIGLRGRLDLLWRQRSRQRLLELKTGGASGELPKSAHRWQVQGYLALLAVRRDPKMKNALATLLYSGTPGEATDFSSRFSIKQLQRVVETRNTLVFSHVSGVPSPPPGSSRCSKCSMLETCATISSLLDWQPPQTETTVQLPDYTPQDRDFFTRNYSLLRKEEREIERQQALLWKTPVRERVEQGSAISDLQPLGEAIQYGKGEWQQSFACKNTSELREGDEILLSDGNPITGEVVTGTILAISSESVTVWSPERIAHPRLLDRYGSSIVHVRTLQNLLRWLQADAHLRQLVDGTLRPRFSTVTLPPQPALNEEQYLAVERAVQAQDYLLIHGPPGTGKTGVIAAIVKQLCAQGQRVLLAAFTNQAVDNMLRRLEREDFHDFVRLGHDRSVDESVSHRLLKHLLEEQQRQAKQAGITVQAVQDEPQDQEGKLTARELLHRSPVVASTTATWSSEKYAPSASWNRQEAPGNHSEEGHAGNAGDGSEALLQFDVAIIDEAGQLTLPAMLGALRFAKRFILVGDEMQLPPLVLSQEAAEDGLKDSLFSRLKRDDYDYMKLHPGETSACVSLKVQYRMNRWISHFASRVFYDGQLQPHISVANRQLAFTQPRATPPGEAEAITRALDPHPPLVFVDVRGESVQSVQDGPKTSNAEARAVRELVAGLLARGIAEGDIGIIAPYKAQVANIRRHLFSDASSINWKALHEKTALSIDTVDRFQGGERSVMILSFATATTPEARSQLREHLTDRNRLNVALTRAQRKLILVGHASALEALPVFDRLLAYCLGLDAVIAYAPRSISPFFSA